MNENVTIPVDDVFNHLPLDHLIGISLLIASLIGMVLLFAWRVIKEINKRK
jgi:hypothetical protein